MGDSAVWEVAETTQTTGTKHPGVHKVNRSILWQMSDDEEGFIRGATPLGFGLLVSEGEDKRRWFVHRSIEQAPSPFEHTAARGHRRIRLVEGRQPGGA